MPSRTNHLGSFLRRCREKLGLTSRQVAALTHTLPELSPLSHSNILAMELGRHIPTFDKILTLGALYHVSTRHFEDQLRRDLFSPASIRPTQYTDARAAADQAFTAGDWRAALEHYSQALSAGDEDVRLSTDIDRTPDDGIGRSDENRIELRLRIASCHIRLGLAGVARDDLERLLEREAPSRDVALETQLLLAESHRAAGHSRLAELHARAALQSAVDAEPERRTAVLVTLGGILHQRGADDDAERVYVAARSELRGRPRSTALAAAELALGRLYHGTGRTTDACRSFRASAEHARELGDRSALAEALVEQLRGGCHDAARRRTREVADEVRAISGELGRDDLLFMSLYHLWHLARTDRQASLARVYHDRLSELIQRGVVCPEADRWSASER